jgi:hypothetical protein
MDLNIASSTAELVVRRIRQVGVERVVVPYASH